MSVMKKIIFMTVFLLGFFFIGLKLGAKSVIPKPHSQILASKGYMGFARLSLEPDLKPPYALGEKIYIRAIVVPQEIPLNVTLRWFIPERGRRPMKTNEAQIQFNDLTPQERTYEYTVMSDSNVQIYAELVNTNRPGQGMTAQFNTAPDKLDRIHRQRLHSEVVHKMHRRERSDRRQKARFFGEEEKPKKLRINF